VKITDDLDVLLAFYDYPAEHWVHLRTTKPDGITQCPLSARDPRPPTLLDRAGRHEIAFTS
jgi:hypothetical protein